MTYTVQFDFAPAYELAISYFAFTQRNSHKALELGNTWVKTLQDQLPSTLQIALKKEPISLSVDLLIRQCPNERTPEAFLTWLAGLSVGDMHELLAPWHQRCQVTSADCEIKPCTCCPSGTTIIFGTLTKQFSTVWSRRPSQTPTDQPILARRPARTRYQRHPHPADRGAEGNRLGATVPFASLQLVQSLSRA